MSKSASVPGGAIALAVALGGATLARAAESRAASSIVEIRTYNLKPGTRDRFHRLAEQEAVPMLRRFGIDVVGYGPSVHDADSYFLIRSFPDVATRQRNEDAFYGSAGWKEGPRERVLADIVSYTTLVLPVDEATLRGLRASGRLEAAIKPVATPSDRDVLMGLNQDYIRSVQSSDVQRFNEILAEDFRCSLPDGSLIDRRRFLERTAPPATISNLEAHDVEVRLLGDFALVHARTTFTTADGRPGSGRYTDVWARRDGRWLAVSAHVTRN